MRKSTIYCFCSHKDTTSEWFTGVEDGSGRMEYINGTEENSRPGIGILTAMLRGLLKVHSGEVVTVVTTTEQHLNAKDNERGLKKSILDLCESKRLELRFVEDTDEARIKSRPVRSVAKPILTRNLDAIQVTATASYPGETDDKIDLLARVDKFGNRKPRTILSEPFESMWIPVAVVCQCGGEMLLEFLGLFPSQNKTETCRCGWSVEVRFRMGE